MPRTLDDPHLSRRDFMAFATAGLAVLLAGCASDDDRTVTGRVTVIGAGPAGMTAAYRLIQHGVDVEVLEAAPTYGGRIKHDRDFTDFPISLGAEWIHVVRRILDEVVDDAAIEVATKTTGYAPSDIAGYYDGELTLGEVGNWADLKFVGSSWLDFYDTYVVPSIESAMRFDTQIVTIDSTGDRIRLTDASGTTRETDQVIVTVPLKQLQNRAVEFRPPLPARKTEAIAEANVWSGIKVFLEFTDAFYPTALETEDSETPDGQRLYYDAAYGQDTDANVLGLFAVGAQAEVYQSFGGGNALRDHILDELDEIFDGAASPAYVKHLVQNWNEEPFIGAAYLADEAPSGISRALATSIDDRIFFAGSAYTSFADWSSVHTAARSAIEAVDELLG